MSPPQATKAKIYEWKENYLKILQHIGNEFISDRVCVLLVYLCSYIFTI